jgi:hypothetical protein
MTTRKVSSPAVKARDKKAVAKIEKLAAKYEAAGMTEKEAKARAYIEAREKPRKDFRRAFKKKKGAK